MTHKLTPDEIRNALAHATGSERFFATMMPNHFTTQGVQYMAELCEAYWLIDAIISHQRNPKVRAEEFQVWTLHVAAKPPARQHNQIDAILICTDGNSTELTRQNIEFTDFPLDEIKIFTELGSIDGKHTARILMLPTEH